MSGGAGIVIVGAGQAGARAAAALREGGFDGPVTLIGEEIHAPYERPPLSKAAIVSPRAPDLPVIAGTRSLAESGVEFLAGVAATSLDPRGRALRLSDGRELGYDKLVLATGARPRRLTAPGAERTLTLRDYPDALALRERFLGARRVAIVGGGFIGLELASSARQLGCEVTVIEAAPRVLQRATPPEVSARVEALHRAEGVAIYLNAGVAAFTEDGVTLATGRQIPADVIVVGVGAVPETSLAATAGLVIDNGVAVDARLRTRDPDIFAIGDCASFPHPLFDGRRLRLEAWRNAVDQGNFVARGLTGDDAEFRGMPWFWSDQYDVCLQIAGLPDLGDSVVARELGDEATLWFHIAQDRRLVGVSALGPLGKIGKEVKVGEMLIARRASPDPAALVDPRVRLKTLL